MTKKSPVHPGRILRETVFPEACISISEAALALSEPEIVLRQILAEEASLSAALCLKIARLFNSSPEMWIRLQASYDLHQARLDEKVIESLKSIVPAQNPSRAAPCEGAAFGTASQPVNPDNLAIRQAKEEHRKPAALKYMTA